MRRLRVLLGAVLCACLACAPPAATPAEPTALPNARPAAYPEISAVYLSGARQFSPAEGETGIIRYSLDAPALVRLRIVDKGTPGIILRTVLDWTPRLPGPNTEAWDGRDRRGVLVAPQSVSFVLTSEPRRELLSETDVVSLTALRYPAEKHFLHPVEQCGDLDVLVLAPAAGEAVSGTAEVVASLSGRLGLPDGEYHVVVYLDGRTAWDGRVPGPHLARTFDSTNLVNGEHELAVTFNDLHDHAGSGRVSFVVDNR
jgi:hypothetical protein